MTVTTATGDHHHGPTDHDNGPADDNLTPDDGSATTHDASGPGPFCCSSGELHAPDKWRQLLRAR